MLYLRLRSQEWTQFVGQHWECLHWKYATKRCLLFRKYPSLRTLLFSKNKFFTKKCKEVMQLWCLHSVIPWHCLRNLKSSLKNQIDQQEHRKQSEWQHDDGLKKTKMISLGCHCSSLRAKDPSLSLSQYVVYFCLENVLLYWSMDQYNNVWKGVVEKGVARKGLKLRQHV